MTTGNSDKTLSELRREISELRHKLDETQETLAAIRNGEVDAIVVSSNSGDKIFSLTGSETPYRLLVEKMDEGSVTLLSDGTILYANQSFSNLLSFPLEKITGTKFTELISENDRNRFMKLLATGKKKPVKGDVTLVRPAGKVTLHLSLSPLPSDIHGDVCIIVSDITETINRQNYLSEMVEARTSELRNANRLLMDELEKTRQIEKELQASRERLNLALENGNIGTWEWDNRKNKLIFDERTERMFGFEPGTFSGAYADFLNCIHEEDVNHLSEAFRRTIEKNLAFETIVRVNKKDGDSNFITAKAIVTYDPEGKPSGMSGVCMDVTEMKRGAEQAIIRLNEELLRSNKDLQQFAYVASHDLQEPLRMISSFTQLLQMRYQDKLDQEGEEFIRYAVEGSKRMYELLNGLLAYSRIQTRGGAFSMVDMNNVVEMVKENLSLVVNETEARIKSDKLPGVYADEHQMIQLMQNLIENSIKFRSGTPDITISGETSDGQTIISVKDKGIGIHPQYHEKIFRIFQRLHRSDEYPGTGIGLSICKRIVERHDGRIWVESEPGKGTAFFFSLPAEDS